MTGRLQSLWRLLAIQASWNYERMQGIGMAWASLPLLEPLRGSDPHRYRQAVARASEFFNANPFLAGAAVGAAAREELAGTPGPQVARLRTALCGPLGALGDQLFWLGTVPGLAAAGLVAVALGAGWWAPVGVVAAHLAIRAGVGLWALDQGLRHGRQVGPVIQRSALPAAIEWAGRLASLAMGLALPLVAAWQLEPVPVVRRWLAIALALALFRLSQRSGGRLSPVELTLGTMVLTFLWHWSTT